MAGDLLELPLKWKYNEKVTILIICFCRQTMSSIRDLQR